MSANWPARAGTTIRKRCAIRSCACRPWRRKRSGICIGPAAGRAGDAAVRLGGAGRLKSLAFEALAFQLAGAANRLGAFAGAAFRRFLVMPAQLHFPENSLPLHLLLERLQRLIDIVVAYQNLHLV